MLSDVETSLQSYDRYASIDYSEDEWAVTWIGMWHFLCLIKKEVKEALDFDPERSCLYGDFPLLLRHACDTQIPIIYDPSIREFGVSILDGGSSRMSLSFDPWSGKPLPTSLRDKWFEAIEKLGIDPWNEREKVPAQFNDETWWRQSYVSEKRA